MTISYRPLSALLALGVLLAGGPAARADETVRQVQEELRKRNLYFGDVDGTLSAPTTAALRRYQQRKGFPSTGQPDPVTLHSLMILAPATAFPAAASPPSGPAAAHPWPDITVLRSDEGRPGPVAEAEEAEEAGAPTPSPTAAATPPPRPPPSAASQRRLTVEDARAFIERYLQAGQANDPQAELAFYGDRVAYFDDGTVDRRFIEGDITRYDRRWPERHFTLLEPFSLSPSPDGDPDKTVVNFRYQFSNKGARWLVRGKTDNAWTLTGTRPADLRIVAMKEQRVRE